MAESKNNLSLQEVEKFSQKSSEWWNESGPYKPLHELNITRVSYIKNILGSHFKRTFENETPLKKINVLDIGCGGGLISEPLCRLGASVTGIDPSPENIQIAKEHSNAFLLDIRYSNCLIENLDDRKTYDAVLSLEVLEHVPNPEQFVRTCFEKVSPGGILILSTLNRTLQSYLKGIVAAEYILKWVPKGTHSWSQFLKPCELHQLLKKAGCSDVSFQGISFSPLKNEWHLSDTLEINYFATAKKD
ncbi:bifunctional 2-polyprenyl-6-hydroxyphenol methylase/3-demethylubiquinol 3-O-methyltransferase UbiG [Alphaproteobacteria bacterium]|nr:bifunctional 2-polyprenyl-6-hydroxyphenol methylase/3-demethylubiquinol 3-O-methyltransferase UbiG [Alphaproteobacteria bacterium]